MSDFYDMNEIKRANARAGQHFFEEGTMRFFNSRVGDTVHCGPGGIFFVTSEQFDDSSPRRYTVREFVPATGRINTVGKFQEHATNAAAHRRAKYFGEHGCTDSVEH
jgi:hypothetical protein